MITKEQFVGFMDSFAATHEKLEAYANKLCDIFGNCAFETLYENVRFDWALNFITDVMQDKDEIIWCICGEYGCDLTNFNALNAEKIEFKDWGDVYDFLNENFPN